LRGGIKGKNRRKSRDGEGRESKKAEEGGEGRSDGMVVRVSIRLKSSTFGEVKTMAIANSAYESEVPEAILPEGVASLIIS